MKKLKHTAKKFFRVIKNIRNTIYELKISNFKIHNVFSAFLLNRANLSTSLTKVLKIKAREKEYEISKILKERKHIKKRVFNKLKRIQIEEK